MHAAPPSPSTSGAPAADPCTQQMGAMFDKVLSLCTASLSTSQRCTYQPSPSRGQQSAQHTSCKVCGSGEHTTHAHCRLYRLCLNCYSPGHMRRECSQTSSHATAPFLRAHFKLASPCDERGSMGGVQDTLTSAPDLQSVYINCCNMYPADKTVILVGS